MHSVSLPRSPFFNVTAYDDRCRVSQPCSMYFKASSIEPHSYGAGGYVSLSDHRHHKKITRTTNCVRSCLKPSNASNSVTEKVSTDYNLLDYILEGPLVDRAGISREFVLESIVQWEDLGRKLSHHLEFDALNLSRTQKLRIFHYYLPLYFWCLQQIEKLPKPVMIGISAPQGCGKTTVVESLEYLFHETARKAASVSIDDFYLTFKDQVELAKSYHGNKLLELRGNAGTHDLVMGTETLTALKQLTSRDGFVKLPRYDKSANSGRGDRANSDEWPVVQGPLDVILFEGWMLGFNPISQQNATSVDPQLEIVNEKLSLYSTWHNFVDAWIVIQVKDPSWVYKWRLQAEVQMRSKGKAGMTDEQVEDFVARYMPAYKAYLPGLYENGLGLVPTLNFFIDESRSPQPY